MKTLLALLAAAFMIGTASADVRFQISIPFPVVPLCGVYAGDVGFYDGNCGYWTGNGWDREWYGEGHGGYGHGNWHRDDRGHRG